ncbi:adenosylcobinamide-GDP ribazoletransferase [Lichenicoccus sp.]|uniref:adenosylcobinamide-GDP ribazoletransferase n=1 Tax=Lichenicoccus sp. TaxID=2781899 RepID=UPI003D0FC00C
MIRRLRTDLAATIGFFTRLPVGWLMPEAPNIDMARAAWAYPLAGALVGLCSGGVYAIGAWCGLSPMLCACWSLAAMVLLTGGLHEDGLADMADGFGGGRDVEAKLAIMRDSRIGSYGTLALLLSSIVRIAAVAAIATPARVVAALVASGAISRAAIVLLLVLLPPARSDGLASSLRTVPRLAVLAALAIASAFDAALLDDWLLAPACMLIVTVLLAALSRAQIGGQTGDVLGAGAVLAECAVLSVLSQSAYCTR